jgi:hypothetical protein
MCGSCGYLQHCFMRQGDQRDSHVRSLWLWQYFHSPGDGGCRDVRGGGRQWRWGPVCARCLCAAQVDAAPVGGALAGTRHALDPYA